MERLRKFTKGNYNRSKLVSKNADLKPSKRDGQNADADNSNFVTDFKERKFSFTWRIKNLDRCSLKCQEFLESPIFSTKYCGEAKWSLRVYPRGRKISKHFRLNKTCGEISLSNIFNDDFDCEKVGVFLHRISTNSENSTFRYRFSCERYLLNGPTNRKEIYIYPNVGVAEIKADSTNSSEYGTDDLYCLEDFSKQETLLVRCDIFITNVFNEPSNCVTDFPKSCTLLQDLKEMYENGKFSDITLQAKDVKFLAHKGVLASRSQVFDAMFQHDMKETQSGIVQIFDMEPKVLGDLLQYIYTGSVDDFTVQKAISLYSVAEKYLLEELKNWCVSVILVNLKVENVCQVAILADLHSDPKLKEATLNMFHNSTSDIFKRDEWQQLARDINHRDLVSEILQDVSTDFITDCENN